MNKILRILMALGILMTGCRSWKEPDERPGAACGSLFIIGGGSRSPEMIRRMVDEAAMGPDDYIAVLPMSSEEPDTAFFYARQQFEKQGIPQEKICNFMLADGALARKSMVDSLTNASLIYITGGDQARFMGSVLNTPIHHAIKTAYNRGGLVAGTSAGAAAMSKMMITGKEKKHPEYTGDFRTIEASNIELAEGLGLLENVVIDQHFIYRMRMNRLISVVLENPGIVGLGIDEATAVLIRKDSAEVVGSGQVVRLSNPGSGCKERNGLLEGEGLVLDVYITGSRFSMNR